MTYEKIKKSIASALHKAMSETAPNTDVVVYQVMLHMEPRANTWNRAAIELSEENVKVPSRRRKIVCYPEISAKNTSEISRMSTNEWNDLALALRKSHRERSKNENSSKVASGDRENCDA